MLLVAPAPPLRPYVQHYWLSRDNQAPGYRILPDGAVDLVVQWRGDNARVQVFGTTTAPKDLALPLAWDFLGIRFQPGQSRHFLRASAEELTDTCHNAEELLDVDLPLEPLMVHADPFTLLDQRLTAHLLRHPPTLRREDPLITTLIQQQGQLSITRLADLGARSRRQLERDFLVTVGISAKLFARIQRFHHACLWLGSSQKSLADIALHCGYSDQSHMNRDFNALAGCTPLQWRCRTNVAFFQD